MQKLKRPLLLAVLFLIFAGLIVFSTLAIRYPVSGTPKSEFAVTELSLTHGVERARDGKLVLADKAGKKGGTKGTKKGSKACPT